MPLPVTKCDLSFPAPAQNRASEAFNRWRAAAQIPLVWYCKTASESR